MKITDITEDMLPLPTVEINVVNTWILTNDPFQTLAEAKNIRDRIIAEYHFEPAAVKIGSYTKERWRLELIMMAIQNRDSFDNKARMILDGMG